MIIIFQTYDELESEELETLREHSKVKRAEVLTKEQAETLGLVSPTGDNFILIESDSLYISEVLGKSERGMDKRGNYIYTEKEKEAIWQFHRSYQATDFAEIEDDDEEERLLRSSVDYLLKY